MPRDDAVRDDPGESRRKRVTLDGRHHGGDEDRQKGVADVPSGRFLRPPRVACGSVPSFLVHKLVDFDPKLVSVLQPAHVYPHSNFSSPKVNRGRATRQFTRVFCRSAFFRFGLFPCPSSLLLQFCPLLSGLFRSSPSVAPNLTSAV